MFTSISKKDLPKKLLFNTLFCLSLLFFFSAAPFLNGFERGEKKNAVKDILLAIHKEVLELGKRENEDFIKRGILAENEDKPPKESSSKEETENAHEASAEAENKPNTEVEAK